MDSINPNIQYSLDFEGYEAAVEAGLDLPKWEEGGYPPFFMAKVIAWHRNHNALRNHMEDTIARVMKQRAKRKS